MNNVGVRAHSKSNTGRGWDTSCPRPAQSRIPRALVELSSGRGLAQQIDQGILLISGERVEHIAAAPLPVLGEGLEGDLVTTPMTGIAVIIAAGLLVALLIPGKTRRHEPVAT